MKKTCLLALLALASATAHSSPAADDMEGALLRGAGTEALQLAARLAAPPPGSDDSKYAECVTARLRTPPALQASVDPLAAQVALAYQQYWQKSFPAAADRKANEAALQATLAKLAGLSGQHDFDEVETAITAELKARGFFALTGMTPPFRELMLWRKQTERDFAVALPEQEYTAHVVMLNDFVSLGWAAWATCEHRANGGWATDTALYAVMPRYAGGVDGSEFRAVLLTHETQHFADKHRFRWLKPWELEYRAKLAELWAADADVARERLGDFASSQSDDEALAHPHANRKLISALTQALGRSPQQASLAELHSTAAALLRQDSELRIARGESATMDASRKTPSAAH